MSPPNAAHSNLHAEEGALSDRLLGNASPSPTHGACNSKNHVHHHHHHTTTTDGGREGGGGAGGDLKGIEGRKQRRAHSSRSGSRRRSSSSIHGSRRTRMKRAWFDSYWWGTVFLTLVMGAMPTLAKGEPYVRSGSNSLGVYRVGGGGVEGEGKGLFLLANNTQVTAQAGATASLPCRLSSPLGDGMVSWVRRRHYQLLTIGRQVYSSDSRLGVKVSGDGREWTLMLRFVDKQDAGQYQCQVSSSPPTALTLHLHVIEAQAEIVGGPERYIHHGSSLLLVCSIKGATEPPVYVFWYRGDRMINYDAEDGVAVDNSRRSSKLYVASVSGRDEGNYTCLPSNAASASVLVTVIQRENPVGLLKNSKPEKGSPPPSNSSPSQTSSSGGARGTGEGGGGSWWWWLLSFFPLCLSLSLSPSSSSSSSLSLSLSEFLLPSLLLSLLRGCFSLFLSVVFSLPNSLSLFPLLLSLLRCLTCSLLHSVSLSSSLLFSFLHSFSFFSSLLFPFLSSLSLFPSFLFPLSHSLSPIQSFLSSLPHSLSVPSSLFHTLSIPSFLTFSFSPYLSLSSSLLPFLSHRHPLSLR